MLSPLYRRVGSSQVCASTLYQYLITVFNAFYYKKGYAALFQQNTSVLVVNATF